MVVPHALGLHDPGLHGFRCVLAVRGALSRVECCVEGFQRGAFAACEPGGLEESLPAAWGVFRIYFRGIGLGRHEDSVCPVGARFEDVDGGLSRVSYNAMVISILEGWRCGVALRLRS